MKQVLLCFGLLSLISLFPLIIIKAEEPVTTQHISINGELDSVEVEEMLVEASNLTIKTQDLEMVTFDRFWLALLPIDRPGLNAWGLGSYSGLSGQDADLSGSIVSEWFRVESGQMFTAQTWLPEGASVWVNASGEYLQIYIKMPFSEHFAYSTLEPGQEAEDAAEDKQLRLSYWTPAVVEGIYDEDFGEVELPPIPWGAATSLVYDEPLDAVNNALALLFIPMPTAGYLTTDIAPRFKANLLFWDIQDIPMSFQLGVVLQVRKLMSPVEIHPSSTVAFDGKLIIEFPDGRRTVTEVNDRTEITLLDGTLIIDEKDRLTLEGTASRLTLKGKFGEVDKLTRRVILFNTLPWFLRIVIPILAGLYLTDLLLHVRKSHSQNK